MRVIAGNARGQRLKAPKGREVRPTADRVKEALFNLIAAELEGARVLDLFAGTGNLAIEALSRGAAQAILVDSSPASMRLIRENLKRLHFTERADTWVAPVSRVLRAMARRSESFDIIFLDPPYGQRLIEETLALIARGKLLRETGIIVAEHSVRDEIGARYDSLARRDQRRYGDTLLSFFRLDEASLEQGNSAHGQ